MAPQLGAASAEAQSCWVYSGSVPRVSLRDDSAVHPEPRSLVLHHHHRRPRRLRGVWYGPLRPRAHQRHADVPNAVLE